MVDDRSFHNCKEKLGSGTMLSQIMNLVETAQLNRAPVQRVADAVARCFVPGIVALSFLTWMTWYLMVYTWEALLIFCVTDQCFFLVSAKGSCFGSNFEVISFIIPTDQKLHVGFGQVIPLSSILQGRTSSWPQLDKARIHLLCMRKQ